MDVNIFWHLELSHASSLTLHLLQFGFTRLCYYQLRLHKRFSALLIGGSRDLPMAPASGQQFDNFHLNSLRNVRRDADFQFVSVFRWWSGMAASKCLPCLTGSQMLEHFLMPSFQFCAAAHPLLPMSCQTDPGYCLLHLEWRLPDCIMINNVWYKYPTLVL